MLSYSKDRNKTCPEYYLVEPFIFLGGKQVQTAPELEPGPFNQLPSILLHMYLVALSHDRFT